MAGPVVDDKASNLSTLSEVGRRWLQTGLWVMLGMALIAVALQPVLAPRESSRAIGAFMMAPTAAIALWLIGKQRVRPAVMTLVFGAWLVVTLNSAVHGGVFAAASLRLPDTRRHLRLDPGHAGHACAGDPDYRDGSDAGHRRNSGPDFADTGA